MQGDIVAVSGIEGLNIGDTLCDAEHPEALPFVKIDEPTLSMTFHVNNSPFAGREGKMVTSRNIRARPDRLPQRVFDGHQRLRHYEQPLCRVRAV